MLALALAIIAVLAVATVAALYHPQQNSDPAALNLQVSVSPAVGSGQSLAVTANLWLNNTLSKNNFVTIHYQKTAGRPTASGWPMEGLTTGCVAGYPLGIGLLAGHYAANNVSDGQLVPYQFVFGCPGDQIILQSLTFLPHSSTAVAKTNFGTPTWDISSTFTYQNVGPGGYTLVAGEYTVVAGDVWGQIAFAYFSVAA